MDTSHDKELNKIAAKLAEAFGSTAYKITRDPQSDSVFISIRGLEKFPDSLIEAIATPMLDELDLEYEEIVLIPE